MYNYINTWSLSSRFSLPWKELELCWELWLGLDITGLRQQFQVVPQLLTHLKLETQGSSGAVVHKNCVLVQPVKHADLQVYCLTIHPDGHIYGIGQGPHWTLINKQLQIHVWHYISASNWQYEKKQILKYLALAQWLLF